LGRASIIFSVCFFLVLPGFLTALAAVEAQPRTRMQHTPPGYFIPAHRIQVEAQVKDPAGVEIVRCYFRAAGEANYVFVPMTHIRRSTFAAVIPAPAAGTDQIEYLFLSVNTDNQVVKSQVFYIEKRDEDRVPAWQEAAGEDEIRLYMELDQVPSELAGFSDNIVIDAVESGVRFGIAAGGIYQVSGLTTASTSGAAATATSAGTVTAGSAGIGTATLVTAGAAGAAAVGGTAVAVTSDSGSSGSSSDPVLERHFMAAAPYTGDGVPPQSRDTFHPDEGVVAYNYINNVNKGDTSHTVWQSPDGYSFRIDNPPAPRDGSMSLSTELPANRLNDFSEGRWTVEFYYRNQRLYADSFVVRSDSDVTVDWRY